MPIRFLSVLRNLLRLSPAVFFPACAFACSCMQGHTACQEVTEGSAVFIGRVLSVSPPFVNRLNPASRAQADRVLQFHEQLDAGAAGQSLQSLKETFRELAPGLSPDQSSRLKEAGSREALLHLFDQVLDKGSYVTLEVGTVFSGGFDDDDDDKATAQPADKQKSAKDDDDDKPKQKNVKAGDDNDKSPNAKNAKSKDDDDDDDLTTGKITAIWTPIFDCGVEFQVGETYLVYGSMDEDTDIVETDTCMGTRRLSDAGADLPYLSFFKSNPNESSHIDGFVTSDPSVHANPPEGDRIRDPVPGALIELKSDDAIRYATSDSQGRFLFDGLAGDSYRLVAYSAERPDPRQIMAGPEELTIKPKACARYVVLAQPKPAAPR